MVREEEGEVKSAYQPSPPMLSHVFNSALLSLDPGEVPSLMTKPRAHPTVFCAWPQGRPGIFSEIYSSRSLALTLFFEPLTLHPSLSPASFVFCSPGKCKDWANRTKRSKSFSAHPSQALKKATFFFSQTLFTLLPTALTAKPEDSSQCPHCQRQERFEKAGHK